MRGPNHVDFLMVTTPDGASFRQALEATTIVLGRSSSNDLPLDDPSVSRIHAKIVRRDDGFYILDTGSKHGTLVNTRRISEPTRLQAGDQILVGRTILSFNGAPTVPLIFDDIPLTAGPGTTILSGSKLRSSSSPSLDAGEITLGGAESGAPAAALRIIGKADKELVFHRPLPEILERIMDLAHEAVPYERGVLMLLQGGKLVKQAVRVPKSDALEGIRLSTTITRRVIDEQDSILTSDAQKDIPGESIIVQHIRSLMCVPLWNNREVIGLLYVDSRHQTGLFTEINLNVLTFLANVAAVKIENARLFEHALAAEAMKQELETAAEIQNHLLPGDGPTIPGFQLDGISRPCRAVGGDYFDYIPLPEGRLAFAVGDVAGKGMPAALLMCSLQASLHALTDQHFSSEETTARLNRLLCRKIPANRFVTFFFGVLDPGTHTLTYTNAGHNPPVVLRADGGLERLAPGGPPLGFFDGSTYRSGQVVLEPNDFIVCYSDGVTEARSPAGEDFGEQKLIDLVRAKASATPADVVSSVFDALDEFHAGTTPGDDLTLVVLKRSA